MEPGQLLYQLDTTRYEAAYRERAGAVRQRAADLERARAAAGAARGGAAGRGQRALRVRGGAGGARRGEEGPRRHARSWRRSRGGWAGRCSTSAARVTGPADLLTTIDRLDPVYVTFQPSSQQLLEWRENPRWRALIEPGSRLAVQVVLPDSTVLPRTGRLDFVAPALDSATGTEEFRAVFQNPDRLLVPGEFVRVRLVGLRARQRARGAAARGADRRSGASSCTWWGRGHVAQTRDVAGGPVGRRSVDHRPRAASPATGHRGRRAEGRAGTPGDARCRLGDSAARRRARRPGASTQPAAAHRGAAGADRAAERPRSSTTSSAGRCWPA